MKEYESILDRIMASLILKRVLQRSFNQTNFKYASSSPIIQRQIIQEDGKIN
jgi:hypothetical protein